MALIYAGNKLNKDSLIEKGFSKDFIKKGFIKYIIYRYVSTGTTSATKVAPKFSDSLTLSPPGGSGQPSQRSLLIFPHGYVPDIPLPKIFIVKYIYFPCKQHRFMLISRLAKYIRVSNRSHRQSLIVASCCQILFKYGKISRGVFIFTISSKEMSFKFSTGQKKLVTIIFLIERK